MPAAEVIGTFEMGFNSEFLQNLGCELEECELSNFELEYQISFNDEWLRGGAYCLNDFCGLGDMDHLVRTSNTSNIFAVLNQTNILSPLSSLYFYGVISSGQKINAGHELKFKF
jgi:hypothetical protein